MNLFECTLASGGGGTLTVTCDESFAGLTITCSKTGKTLTKTCPSVSPYEVVFNIPESGTWTVSATLNGTTYTQEVEISLEFTTVFVAGFDWKAWVDTSRFLDSTDYSTLADLLADEEAIRELCIEHATVDYLCGSDVNENLETVIYNDLFAKWVNLSDYALDNMLANSAIKTAMDEADKYGYGEWCLMPQVLTMTSNTAPSGEVIAYNSFNSGTWQAYKAFDGDTATMWVGGPEGPTSVTSTNAEIGYQSISAIKVNRIKIKYNLNISSPITCTLRGSNDGTNWTNIGDSITLPYTSSVVDEIHEFDFVNSTSYKYNKLLFSGLNDAQIKVYDLQFYAYAPKGNVPVMTSDSAPYGEVSANSYDGGGSFNPWKAFDGDDTSYWRSYDVPPAWIAYKFVTPICVKRIKIKPGLYGSGLRVLTYKVQGSNTGDTNDYTDIYSGSLSSADEQIVNITNNNYYLYYRVYVLTAAEQASAGIISLQFYGRQLSVSVPKMTSNTAPYGEASAHSVYSATYPAWKAFNGIDDTDYNSSSNEAIADFYLRYAFTALTRAKIAEIRAQTGNYEYVCKIKGSNDGSTWYDCSNAITIKGNSRYRQFVELTNTNGYKKYELTIISADRATSDYLSVDTLQFYGLDYSEKEFEAGTNKKWLYDHGLELETVVPVNSGGTANKESSQLYYKQTQAGTAGFAVDNIDLSDYSLMRCKTGNKAQISSDNVYAGFEVFAAGTTVTPSATRVAYRNATNNDYMPNNEYLDISNLNGTHEVAVDYSGSAGRNAEYTIAEWYVE